MDDLDKGLDRRQMRDSKGLKMAAYLAAEQLNSDSEPDVPTKTYQPSKRPKSTRCKNTVAVSNVTLDNTPDNNSGSGPDSNFVQTASTDDSSDSDESEIEPKNAEVCPYLLCFPLSSLTHKY